MTFKEKLAMDSCRSYANPHLNIGDNYESGYLAGFEAAKQLIAQEVRDNFMGDDNYILDHVTGLGNEEV